MGRLTYTFTNGGGPTKELYHARKLEENLREFVNSLGSRRSKGVWDNLLRRLRIEVDEAAVADKENEEPGAKKGSLFSNGKHGKGKSKRRNVLKSLCVQTWASATVAVKDNEGPSLKKRRLFPLKKIINRNMGNGDRLRLIESYFCNH